MSGKHAKLRAWRRGGGTPVKTVVVGGAAWVSISAVLAVAVPWDPSALTGAGPAAPSNPAEDPERSQVLTRSVDRGEGVRVAASPAPGESGPATDGSPGDRLADLAWPTARGTLSTAADAASTLLPSPSEDPPGSGPGAPESPGGSTTPGPTGDHPEADGPSEDPEPSEDDEPGQDPPSEDPGPGDGLPTLPVTPPVGLP